MPVSNERVPIPHTREFRTMVAASIILDTMLCDVVVNEAIDLIDFLVHGKPNPLQGILRLEVETKAVRESLSARFSKLADLETDDVDSAFEILTSSYPPRFTAEARSVDV